MKRVRHERLEEFLTAAKVRWQVMTEAEHRRMEEAWKTAYEDVCKRRHLSGARAEDAYRREGCAAFFIVPFLGHNGPFVDRRKREVVVGYRCEGEGAIPELGQFCGIEFFVTVEGLGWMMAHSHEDHGFGGPVFARRQWM